jgi:glycerophosphoryl diester phosphodiesterase
MKSATRAALAVVIVLATVLGANMEEKPKSARIEVVAHRGASMDAPENTLAAFKLAREQGADWFELDCRQCKGGEVVVIHDDTVDRTTNGKGKVAELTLEQLQALDAGAWKDARYAGERVPTLKAALELADADCGCFVEVKPVNQGNLKDLLQRTAAGKLGRDENFDREFLAAVADSPDATLARAVIADIRAAGKQKFVVLQSFSPVVCGVIAIEAPELKVELLGSAKDAAAWEGHYRWLFLFEFNGLNTSASALTEGRLDVIQSGGKSCAVYTVDDKAEMQRLAEWGVNRIITNKPALCLEELAKLGKR